MGYLYKEVKNSTNVLKVFFDEYPESPRAWDNLGTMACFHKRYTLGDKEHGIDSNDFNSWAAMKEHIEKELKAVIVLPIYMYDHSGLTINTTGFSCPWDSGQIGFIYVTKEKVKEEYSFKRISKKRLGKIKEYLLSEVEIYDEYLRGNVFHFILEDTAGVQIDSNSGFYGSDFKTNGLLDELGIKYKELVCQL
jgi:hypothetical protein